MIKKYAGLINDQRAYNLTRRAPIVGPAVNALGSTIGILEGKPTDEDLHQFDNDPVSSFLPGVAAKRLARRQLGTIRNSSPRATLLSDTVGPYTSALLLALASGATTYAVMGGSKDTEGVAAGIGLLGGALALGTSSLSQWFAEGMKRRTALEQEKADQNHSVLMSLLVPGVAAYNRERRAARLLADEDDRNRLDEQKRLEA